MENPGFIDGINSDELDRQKTIDAAKKKLKAFKMKQSSPTPRPSPTEPQHEDTSSPVPNRDSVNAPSSSSSRPNSHHRRRSSVSTRRESAEMMGIAAATLAELPSSDENEKDSRRRALWALEGKSSSPRDSFVSGFAKVEIPDFPSPDEEIVDRLTKPAFTGPTSIAARRESFGRTLTPSLSSKDQLHTLVEEDEEDDETPSAPTPRTRPPNLNLRPLTLDATSLPSPSLTPSPRIGLKPLTLVQSTAALQNSTMRSNVPNDMLPVKRHSSISYKRSNDPQPARVVSPVNNGAASLPTPDLTPTTTGRPMSPAEESFLYHSHATLLARIADLERAVACRTRPLSFASVSSRLSISSTTSDPPSDEMLSLVKDLKEERDELTREVASWRSQVENLEKQKDTLTRRVEAERRDAWVAQEKVAVVEAEKVFPIIQRGVNRFFDGCRSRLFASFEENDVASCRGGRGRQ
ncbi:hypothetical protein SISSUDRAFT_369976 [Sistotremastrum suecicum HHB10207 ss-3]|uniref:Uncharacterized protein n=1 Tax=Sistotremastrum suecicum HHB10207 ss-3 TaxID=1314776 RepID=A0A166FYP0_9AGAM|nr:hypothetical protein SISSUDRAFT_369976 [Sistotremastrum suecicum HHB10207 ss-3]